MYQLNLVNIYFCRLCQRTFL